jgi:transposase
MDTLLNSSPQIRDQKFGPVLGLVPYRDVIRARVILHLAEGQTISAISRDIGMERRIVRKWGQRFQQKRMNGLFDDPRSGRPPRFSPRSGSALDQMSLRAD